MLSLKQNFICLTISVLENVFICNSAFNQAYLNYDLVSHLQPSARHLKCPEELGELTQAIKMGMLPRLQNVGLLLLQVVNSLENGHGSWGLLLTVPPPGSVTCLQTGTAVVTKWTSTALARVSESDQAGATAQWANWLCTRTKTEFRS